MTAVTTHPAPPPQAGRRRVLRAIAAGACVALARPAEPAREHLELALRETFGQRPIRPGKVRLELPKLAESGNVVPVTISVESPMTERDHVKSIYLFAEKNPLPRILEVHIGPHNGRAQVASRVRLSTSQWVTAVAVLSDDSVWSAAREIEVTVSSCG